MNIADQKIQVELKMTELGIRVQQLKEEEQACLQEHLKCQGKLELLAAMEKEEANTNTSNDEDEK